MLREASRQHYLEKREQRELKLLELNLKVGWDFRSRSFAIIASSSIIIIDLLTISTHSPTPFFSAHYRMKQSSSRGKLCLPRSSSDANCK